MTSNDPGSSWVVFIDFVYCVPKNNSIWVVLNEEQMSKECLCSILDGPSNEHLIMCDRNMSINILPTGGEKKYMTGWWFECCFIFIPIWGKDPV